jgi:hypothetical protein
MNYQCFSGLRTFQIVKVTLLLDLRRLRSCSFAKNNSFSVNLNKSKKKWKACAFYNEGNCESKGDHVNANTLWCHFCMWGGANMIKLVKIVIVYSHVRQHH